MEHPVTWTGLIGIPHGPWEYFAIGLLIMGQVNGRLVGRVEPIKMLTIGLFAATLSWLEAFPAVPPATVKVKLWRPKLDCEPVTITPL